MGETSLDDKENRIMNVSPSLTEVAGAEEMGILMFSLTIRAASYLEYFVFLDESKNTRKV